MVMILYSVLCMYSVLCIYFYILKYLFVYIYTKSFMINTEGQAFWFFISIPRFFLHV